MDRDFLHQSVMAGVSIKQLVEGTLEDLPQQATQQPAQPQPEKPKGERDKRDPHMGKAALNLQNMSSDKIEKQLQRLVSGGGMPR